MCLVKVYSEHKCFTKPCDTEFCNLLQNQLNQHIFNLNSDHFIESLLNYILSNHIELFLFCFFSLCAALILGKFYMDSI